MFVAHEILGVLQIDQRFPKCVRGVFLSARQPRDLHRVFGLRQLQGTFRIDLYRLIRGPIQHVLPSLQELELRIHLLNGASGVGCG